MAMAYYALTTLVTIGFGDLVPGTNMERVGAMCLELAGCIACAVVFGNMAVLLQAFDRAGARLGARLEALRQLCSHYGVPKPLALRAEAHAAELWALHRGVDMGAVMEALPRGLHADVLLHLRGGALRSSQLFRDCPPAMLRDLAMRLQPQACLHGDDLLRSAAAAAALVFIEHGRAGVRRGSLCVEALTAGASFGEAGFFDDALRRRYSLIAEGTCHILTLSRADLDDVLHRFPEALSALRTRAREAKRMLRAAAFVAAALPKGAAALRVRTVGDADGGIESESESESESEEKRDGGGGGVMLGLEVEGCGVDAPPAAILLAHRLSSLRATAAAQQRVMRARLAAAASSYAQLDVVLATALAARGIAVV